MPGIVAMAGPGSRYYAASGGGGNLLFEMNMAVGAAENAGWVTAQTETYITRTHNATGGPTGGGSYDMTMNVGAGGDNYYGWSDRTTAEAVAGETRYYRMAFKWLTGTDFGGGTIVDKRLIPHDSTNSNQERAILQIEANSTNTVYKFQHDGGDNIISQSTSTAIDTWVYIQWEIKYSSSVDAADGSWKVWINNNTYASPTISDTAMVQNVATGANSDLMRMGYVNSSLASGAYGFRIGAFEVGDAFDSAWSA